MPTSVTIFLRCAAAVLRDSYLRPLLAMRAPRFASAAFLLLAVGGMIQAANATCPTTVPFPQNSFPAPLTTGTTANGSDVISDIAFLQQCPLFSGNVGIGTSLPGYALTMGGGQIAASAGSAGAPSYSFTEAPNSGMYLTDVNGFSLSATGVKVGSFYDGSARWMNDSGYSNTSVINWSTGNPESGVFDLGLSRYAASVLAVGTGGQGSYNGTLIVGNVGIGTASPTALLAVAGNASIGNGTVGSPSLTIQDQFPYYNINLTTRQGSAPAGDNPVIFTTNGAGSGIYGNYGDLVLASRTGGSNNIDFLTGAGRTLAMTINGSGNVGIGTTSPTALLSVNGAANNTTGVWGTFSDRRLKDIAGNYDRGLDAIVRLQPVSFRYKKDNPLHLPSGDEHVGLVAQDLQTVFPEAVSRNKSGYLEVNLSSVQFAMINAIRELKAENDKQNAANASLTKRLDAQAAELSALRAADTRLEARLERLERTRLATSN